MNIGFLKVINAIDAEIHSSYLPGAILWADENHAGAWSNAIDRLNAAIDRAIETGHYEPLKYEGEVYGRTLQDLLARYRAERGRTEQLDFLESISRESGVEA